VDIRALPGFLQHRSELSCCLPSNSVAKNANTCCIAAGPGQGVHEPLRDHIRGHAEDRNGPGRFLHSANHDSSGGLNDIDFGFDQIRSKFRNQVNVEEAGDTSER
jgi:hypothetical protein